MKRVRTAFRATDTAPVTAEAAEENMSAVRATREGARSSDTSRRWISSSSNLRGSAGGVRGVLSSCVLLAHCENIPAYHASDWPVVRIYQFWGRELHGRGGDRTLCDTRLARCDIRPSACCPARVSVHVLPSTLAS
eukprot:1603-Pyramimonas_sp.AAC.1